MPAGSSALASPAQGFRIVDGDKMEERPNFSVRTPLDRMSEVFPGGGAFSLEELLSTLRRRIWLILAITAAGVLLTAAVATMLTSRYTAVAKVLVADKSPEGPDLTAAVRGLPPDVAFMSSQVQVVASRNLAAAVIDKLGLDSDPEFNAALQPRSFFQRMTDALPVDRVRQAFGLPSGALDPELAKRLEREEVIDTFLNNLFTEVVEASRVIDIWFTSEDREKAARIANAVADTYIDQHLENQYQTIRRTMAWLNDRVATLRQEVKNADTAVEKFRAERGLLRGTRGEMLNEQQISDLSSQLVLARSQRAESEARLSQVRGLARSGGTASIAEVVNSPLISSLIAQETEVKRKLAQYSQEYGERHPLPINAKAELQDLQAKIGVEVNRIVQSLQNEVVVATAREQSLQRSLDQFGAQVSKSNKDEVTLRALERDAEAARGTLDNFMQQSHQLNAQDTLRAQQADVTLISYAPIPPDASFPKRKLMVLLAIIVFGLIGVVTALIVDQLDAGFRSSEQVESNLGAPVLGLMPALKGIGRKGRVPGRYALQQPTSAFAEAVRRVHSKLLQDRSVRTVQVTSAEPNEGKTTLSLNLAHVSARLGSRTLLIDTDFRRSEVAAILRLHSSPGLVDLLTGRGSFKDVVQTDEGGADVIVAGGFESQSSEMLILRDLPALLKEVRDRYDLIIVDAPPVISLVDAAMVAGQVDRTILAVKWAGTRRSVVAHAVREIADAGGTLGGVILTKVDVRRHSLYGFGDSGQYYGRYKKYYDVS